MVRPPDCISSAWACGSKVGIAELHVLDRLVRAWKPVISGFGPL